MARDGQNDDVEIENRHSGNDVIGNTRKRLTKSDIIEKKSDK